jgi:hypothetical protein
MSDFTISDVDPHTDLVVSWEVDDGFIGHGQLHTTIDWSDIDQLIYDHLDGLDPEEEPDDICSFVQSDDGCTMFDEEGFNAALTELVYEVVEDDFNQRIGFCNVQKDER